MKTCAKCGQDYSENKKYCLKCGILLDQTKQMDSIKCNQCETSNPSDFKFCKKCGQEIGVIKNIQQPLSLNEEQSKEINTDKKTNLSSFADLIKKAEQGDADAQYILGVMYKNGEGVPQDNAEAMKWLHKAAENGNETAKEQILEVTDDFNGKSDFTAALQMVTTGQADAKEGAEKVIELVKSALRDGLEKKEQAYAYRMIADRYFLLEEYHSSYSSIRKALKIKRTISLSDEEEKSFWQVSYELMAVVAAKIEPDNADEAIRLYKEVIELTDHPQAHHNIGIVYLKCNQKEQAFMHLKYIINNEAIFKDYFDYAGIKNSAIHNLNIAQASVTESPNVLHNINEKTTGPAMSGEPSSVPFSNVSAEQASLKINNLSSANNSLVASVQEPPAAVSSTIEADANKVISTNEPEIENNTEKDAIISATSKSVTNSNLKWIISGIALLVVVLAVSVSVYIFSQKKKEIPLVQLQSSVTRTPTNSKHDSTRILALDALRNGTDLSVTVSKIPKLEKVVDAAKELGEVSPRYQEQVTTAENTLDSALKNRDKNLMAYFGKVVELRRYTPEQISYAMGVMNNGDLTLREKKVIELLTKHVEYLRENKENDPTKLLSDFSIHFNDFVD